MLEHADVVVRLPLWVRGIPTTSSLNWPSSKIPPTGMGNTPASLSGSPRRLLPADTENANWQSTLRVWELTTPGIRIPLCSGFIPASGGLLGGCLHTVANSFIPASGGLPSEDTGNTRRARRRGPSGKTLPPKDAGNTLNAADAMLKIGTASGGRGSSLPPEALPFILFRLSSADCPPGGRCP